MILTRRFGVTTLLLFCCFPWSLATADALEDAYNAGYAAGFSEGYEAGSEGAPIPGTVIMKTPGGTTASGVGFYWDSDLKHWEAYGLSREGASIVERGRGQRLPAHSSPESFQEWGIQSEKTSEELRAILESIQSDHPDMNVLIVPNDQEGG